MGNAISVLCGIVFGVSGSLLFFRMMTAQDRAALKSVMEDVTKAIESAQEAFAALSGNKAFTARDKIRQAVGHCIGAKNSLEFILGTNK